MGYLCMKFREVKNLWNSNFFINFAEKSGMAGICQQQQYWQAINLQAAENGNIFREVTIFPKI